MTACKDKKPNVAGGECTTCQSVLEAKDYFLFKTGSWWVYEEETTHERDSMYVILANNDPNSYGFECNIKSSLTDYTYFYWPVYYENINGCSASIPIHKRCLYIRREKAKFQDDLGESDVFFINYKTGDFIYAGANGLSCPNNTLTVGLVMDEYVIQNDTFGKTVRMDELCDYAEGRQPTKFYYTKGVGIVRKEFIDSNQVWNLVNYYIAP